MLPTMLEVIAALAILPLQVSSIGLLIIHNINFSQYLPGVSIPLLHQCVLYAVGGCIIRLSECVLGCDYNVNNLEIL